MFTGFPAIVAVSQNITVATPSEAYFSQSSSSVVQNISSNSLSSQLISSLSISSPVSSSVISSSSIVVSSSESKLKVLEVEAPKLIEIKSINSAVKVMQDIKKPESLKETPQPEPKIVVKQEVKAESKVALEVEVSLPVTKIVEIKPVLISSSSTITSLSTVAPKAKGTFAEQITARCEILGCNSSQLIRIMKCESSGNPSAVGSGTYIGLFQFLPSTFNAFKIKAGLPNGEIYNGSDQIHVATYMFANGQANQWGCQ